MPRGYARSKAEAARLARIRSDFEAEGLKGATSAAAAIHFEPNCWQMPRLSMRAGEGCVQIRSAAAFGDAGGIEIEHAIEQGAAPRHQELRQHGGDRRGRVDPHLQGGDRGQRAG